MLNPLRELPRNVYERTPSKRRSSPSIPATLLPKYVAPNVDSIPALNVIIRDECLPDDLMVYDRLGITGRIAQTPIHYARFYPVLPRDSSGYPNGKRGRMHKYFSAPLRHVAHLYLDCAAQLSSGSQSVVLRTPVVLPDRLDGRDEGKMKMVSVVVKLARGVCGAHQRLMEEANLFSSVSRMLPTTAHCSDAASDGNTDFGVDDIPKFYGYYLPVRRDGSMKIRAHDDGCDEECEREVMWASPILLLEECEETISAD